MESIARMAMKVLAAKPLLLLAGVVALTPGPGRGQEQPTFSIVHPRPVLIGRTGDSRSLRCHVYIDHGGATTGAGGWSFGIAAGDGASITSATFAGTAADTFANGGYRDPLESIAILHAIDPAENGGVNGLVTRVTLTTGGHEFAVLPPETGHPLLAMEVAATIPAGGGTARLGFRDGLIAAGESFPLAVVRDGVSVSPAVTPFEISLVEVSDCCDFPLSVGFSRQAIKDGPVFEGILGGDCAIDAGEIISRAPPGSPNRTTVHANIISNLPEGNVQGWTLGIAVDGSAAITSATIAGTSGDLMPVGYRDPEDSLTRTEIIDPAKNGGQKGIVTSVALTIGGLATAVLPSTGTQGVLRVDLESTEPQEAGDQTAELRFQEGLRGPSTAPIANQIVVFPERPVCNLDVARVDVIFRQSADAPFLRGDSNDDGSVNISDIIWTLNALFVGGEEIPCDDAGDANDSGGTDISDAVFLVDYLFTGTKPPPPSPGPDACGPDPSEDDLGCADSICP